MNQMPSFNRPSGNRQIALAKRPAGIPQAGDFEVVTATIPTIEDDRFLVRNLYLSADPAQRGWAANPDLTPIGAPFRSLAVGVVLESRDPTIKEGDLVYGFFGWQDYAVAGRQDLLFHTSRPRAPIPAYGGVLGMPGMTAWLALLDLAPPREGDAVLVSTAAGAVGSVVGQIARARGAHVIGLTSSEEKIERCVTRFGYHAAYNYRLGNLAETLAEARPGGFNIYFDNTGGDILDTAIRAMARHGRIVQCGTAATASWTPPPTGLRNEREIMARALVWSGFVIFDHGPRFSEAVEQLTDMMLAGQLNHEEEIDDGLEKAPTALADLFASANAGKKLIYIGED